MAQACGAASNGATNTDANTDANAHRVATLNATASAELITIHSALADSRGVTCSMETPWSTEQVVSALKQGCP
jgi:hypothetical protein